MLAAPALLGAGQTAALPHSLCVLSSKGTNPILEALPSRPKDLPKAPSPNTILLGIRVSAYKFWGDTNIQSVALTHREKRHFLVN